MRTALSCCLYGSLLLGTQAFAACGKGESAEECTRVRAQAQAAGYCYTGIILGAPYLRDVLPKDYCSTATSSVNQGVASDQDGNPTAPRHGSEVGWRSYDYTSKAEGTTFRIVAFYATVKTGATTAIGTAAKSLRQSARVFLISGGPKAQLWATGEGGAFDFISPAAREYLARRGRPLPGVTSTSGSTVDQTIATPPSPQSAMDNVTNDATRKLTDLFKKIQK